MSESLNCELKACINISLALLNDYRHQSNSGIQYAGGFFGLPVVSQLARPLFAVW